MMSSAAAKAPSLYERLLREHNERIASHFARLAATYHQLKKRNRYYNFFLIRWCRSLIAPGQRILDVGCGRGDVLAALEPAGGVGIDLSQAMVEAAAADFPHLSFR